MKLSRAPVVGRADRDQSVAVALHAEHRMRHQLHVEPALGELAHHRIDQERHVVVDDLDHRDRLALARSFSATVSQRIFGAPGCALFEKIEGALGQPARSSAA